MNMEQLSKSQIVLLTLLVSFVTSIATGIVTVSLMEQAPPVIAQTVNRVIERTIETVAPASQSAGAGVTRTVVVRETELISQAVTKISPSVVRLYASTSEATPFLGLGIVLSAEGSIAIDASSLGEAAEGAVGLSDGTRVRAVLDSRNRELGLAFLQATSTDAKVAWKPATLAGGNPILGQTVVALSGRTVVRVEDGIVTALIPLGEGEASVGTVIDTNISADAILDGTPLMNTDGEIIGVSTSVSRASSSKGFIASSDLMRKTEVESGGESSGAE
ncbi:serine protease [Candidatus Parcubacteria bacterium]|nr:MAG: serine protease [Candidatus Parcubacteria bacterium]